MPFKKQEIQRVIQNKLGLKPRVGKENNAYYKIEDKEVLRITYPKGKGDLHPKTQKSIRRQLALNGDDFADLIKCPLSAKDYEKVIINKINKNKL